MSFEPLRISAVPVTPLVYFADGCHLDGILAEAVRRDMSPAERASLPPVNSPWLLDFDLPLARWRYEAVLPAGTAEALWAEPPETTPEGLLRGQVWGWRASALCAVWVGEDTHQVRKYSATGQMARFAPATGGKVQTSSGKFKGWQKPYPTRLAQEYVWYAVGDARRIEHLLTEHMRAVGKLHGQGMCRVQNWKVEPWHSDWSCERGGELMRVLPVSCGLAGVVRSAKIRAPYRCRAREIPARVPFFEELVP